MKQLLTRLTIIILFLAFTLSLTPAHARAESTLDSLKDSSPLNLAQYNVGSLPDMGCDTPWPDDPNSASYGAWNYIMIGPPALAFTGLVDPCGNRVADGLLPQSGRFVAYLYDNQPSSREYIADLLDNIGIPTVQRAYAQGTGYTAMEPFLPLWKAFRNFAYSLYIVMFVVVGVMIMLRTKVNAQTVITIQSALPNLLITLLLITFSYAIVGFMIDLMYFLIYFVVYLVASTGIITSPTTVINRLLNYSAWGVLFEGRNTIISGIAAALDDILSGLGTGALGVLGTVAAWLSPTYLIVAIALAFAMLKLMWALIKAYVMLIVQTITAPIQILFNALPGSQAFSNWLKKTASYLIPFPVAAGMFIMAAVLIGDPTQSTLFKDWDNNDPNPFSIDASQAIYTSGAEKVWLPPFTFTGSTDINGNDIFALIGLFIFAMTPSAVKMAQEWLQVKESPYTSEAVANLGAGVWPVKGAVGAFQTKRQEHIQRRMYGEIGRGIADKFEPKTRS